MDAQTLAQQSIDAAVADIVALGDDGDMAAGFKHLFDELEKCMGWHGLAFPALILKRRLEENEAIMAETPY